MMIVLNEYQECTASCIFSRDCAQHRTAGDFRSEDGFAPEIVLLRDPEINPEVIVECRSADEPRVGCSNQSLPRHFAELGNGFRRIFG